MTDIAKGVGATALVVLFGLPVVFPNLSQHALTQAMLVVLGYILLFAD